MAPHALPRRLLPGPLLPAVAAAIEAVDLFRLQLCRRIVGNRQPEPDPRALHLGPGDLLRHDAKRRLIFLADEQCGRVIVVGQRPDAIQDLIEEILRMNLLHDFAIDPVSHAKEPVAVDPVNGFRQRRRDTGE